MRNATNALLIYKTDERCVISIPSLFFEIGDFVFGDKTKNAFYLYVTTEIAVAFQK